MFRRILVLADNYQLTDFLLRYIPNVFPSSEYHVLSVIDFTYEIMSVTDYIQDTLEESAIKAMLHCTAVLEESGIMPRKTILKGNFQAVVEKYVRDHGIGLIATEFYIDEEKKKSQFSWHTGGLFKSVKIPIFAMDRPVPLKKPESVSILYTDSGYSEGALTMGLELAKFLEAPCMVLYFGRRNRRDVFNHINLRSQQIGVSVQIDTRECTSSGEIVDIVGGYDIFVTSRGGRSLMDRAKMLVKRLPISKVEIDTITYVPVPMLLVGESAEVSHGY